MLLKYMDSINESITHLSIRCDLRKTMSYFITSRHLTLQIDLLYPSQRVKNGNIIRRYKQYRTDC